MIIFTYIQSAFSRGIHGIVFFCSKEKVARVCANWIVALMQYAKPFRNRTNVNYPTDPVCSDLSAVALQQPISEPISPTIPTPAFSVSFSSYNFLEVSSGSRWRESLRLEKLGSNVHLFVDAVKGLTDHAFGSLYCARASLFLACYARNAT